MVIINKDVDITRDDFYNILKENTGIVIFKFGATWCRPCQIANPFIEARLKSLDDRVNYMTLDVDESFDLYGHLQSKKMVSGIPAMLAYVKGNTDYVSNYCVMSCKSDEINRFFDHIEAMLKSL